MQAIAEFRFNLAFENSQSPGYVTEKVYDGLSAGTIPVYWGAPDVDEYVPEGSIIVWDGDNATALAEQLRLDLM